METNGAVGDEQGMTDGEGGMTRTGLKRRGILAAGAAVIAGIVAKKAAGESPVAANDGVWQFPYVGSTSVNGAAFSVNNSGANAVSDAIDGFAGAGNGVYGSSSLNHGIHGRSGGAGYAGIFGEPVNNASTGVLGNGTGTGGGGVQGQNALYGVVGTVGNVDNTIGVYGKNESATGNNNIGVYGASNTGYGILGVSGAGTPYSGITGACYTASGAAFAGGPTQATAFAAYFTGKVNIDGTFFVNGAQKYR